LQFICDCGESIAARNPSVWRRSFHQDKGESGSFDILKHASEDPTLPRAKRKCSTCQSIVEHVYFQQVRRSDA
jgi:DNA-directed RNA polymerase subunit M/transcription elongation factor TFIIS